HLDLPSFPTRRSSDLPHLQMHLGKLLGGEAEAGEAVEGVEQRRVRLLVLLELAAEAFQVAGVVQAASARPCRRGGRRPRRTSCRSEEHTSELQSPAHL